MSLTRIMSAFIVMLLFSSCMSNTVTTENPTNTSQMNSNTKEVLKNENKNEVSRTENTNVSLVVNTNSTDSLKASPTETTSYEGSFFSIKFPKSFTARPDTMFPDLPLEEAFFTSPDGAVEFYVYSPQWGGEPKYMNIASNEKLSDTKTETKGEGLEKTTTTWMTIVAKDSSYTRSLVSIREQVDTGSDLHHVFGIKYKDQASYDKYKDEYVAFKKTLQQFAD